jgi:DMSO/TMAO reductase YedYZ heme-binding membrane subunit
MPSEDDPTDSHRRARRFAGAAFLAAFAYAVARYVVLGTVPAAQLPLFVANKALAVAAVALIAGCLSIGPLVRTRLLDARWMRERKPLGLYGFAFGAVHAVLTVAMLSPAIYGKLYDTAGRFTFAGGLAITTGALMAVALAVPAVTSLSGVRKAMTPAAWRSAQRFAVPALGAALVHLIALGWKSWTTPATWPNGLPPLTLFAAGIIAFAIFARTAAIIHRWSSSAGRARSAPTATVSSSS